MTDITTPKTFCIYSLLCIIFGCLIGVGCYISFAPYNLDTNDAIACIVILFIAGAVPPVFLNWWITESNMEESDENLESGDKQ